MKELVPGTAVNIPVNYLVTVLYSQYFIQVASTHTVIHHTADYSTFVKTVEHWSTSLLKSLFTTVYSRLIPYNILPIQLSV